MRQARRELAERRAIVVVALARVSTSRPLRLLAVTYVSIFRSTPLLVQILLVYFGLPQLGVTIEAIPAAILALSLNAASYLSENFRAGILGVDHGQREAASSLGMGYGQALRRVILPQAARVAVPPLSNTFISLVKDTSLAAAITVPELFQAAQRIVAVTYEPLILYIEAAVIYLAISSILSALQARLELRLGRYGGFMEARA